MNFKAAFFLCGCVICAPVILIVQGAHHEVVGHSIAANATAPSCIRISWNIQVDEDLPLRVWRRRSQGEPWHWVGDSAVFRKFFDDGGLMHKTRYQHAVQILDEEGLYPKLEGDWIMTPDGRGSYRGLHVAHAEGTSLTDGVVVRLKNDHLFLIHSRHADMRDGMQAGQRVVSRISEDNGRTWSKERLLFRDQSFALGKVSLERLGDGGLGFACTAFVIPKFPDSPGDEVNIGTNPIGGFPRIYFSYDEGETWSEPINISRSAGLSHPYVSIRTDGLVRGKNDRLFLPTFGWEELTPEGKHPHLKYVKTLLLVSDNHGRNWKKKAEFELSGLGYWEASAAPFGDGEVFLVGRNLSGWYYAANSRDNGETWSPLRRLDIHGWHSPPIAREIPGENAILLAYHAKWPALDHGDRREVLGAKVSFDGGYTFKGYTEIEYWGTEYRSFQNNGLRIDNGEAFLYYSTSPKRDGHGDARMAIVPVSEFLEAARTD